MSETLRDTIESHVLRCHVHSLQLLHSQGTKAEEGKVPGKLQKVITGSGHPTGAQLVRHWLFTACCTGQAACEAHAGLDARQA